MRDGYNTIIIQNAQNNECLQSSCYGPRQPRAAAHTVRVSAGLLRAARINSGRHAEKNLIHDN
jgi:hypothetical protein